MFKDFQEFVRIFKYFWALFSVQYWIFLGGRRTYTYLQKERKRKKAKNSF